MIYLQNRADRVMFLIFFLRESSSMQCQKSLFYELIYDCTVVCIHEQYKLYAGYMPSDLYNLNSSYGSVEELKYCIEELHSHDLLVCCAGNDIKVNIWRCISRNYFLQILL